MNFSDYSLFLRWFFLTSTHTKDAYHCKTDKFFTFLESKMFDFLRLKINNILY